MRPGTGGAGDTDTDTHGTPRGHLGPPIHMGHRSSLPRAHLAHCFFKFNFRFSWLLKPRSTTQHAVSVRGVSGSAGVRDLLTAYRIGIQFSIVTH